MYTPVHGSLCDIFPLLLLEPSRPLLHGVLLRLGFSCHMLVTFVIGYPSPWCHAKSASPELNRIAIFCPFRRDETIKRGTPLLL